MTRQETELELALLRTQIARLQGRKAELQIRLLRADDDDDPFTDLPRAGWPIRRSGQVSVRRISISAPSRIAV